MRKLKRILAIAMLVAGTSSPILVSSITPSIAIAASEDFSIPKQKINIGEKIQIRTSYNDCIFKAQGAVTVS